MNDIEIANSIEPLPIALVADKFEIDSIDLDNYGKYKAKVVNYDHYIEKKIVNTELILVTAINPTPAGEGKTTVSIGLADGLNKLGHKTIAALREPSLGPVFGIKGGAAGGGYSQVIPMEDINLHFTGDFHAITSANNLLCALLDNHIKQGNELQINPSSITFKRVLDMNDRQLRYIVDGLQGPNQAKSTLNGVTREDGFDISVASEVMAVFCLATSLEDLREKLGKIVVAKSFSGNNITAKDLNANGAMTALLKDAIKPNLVQTLEQNPTIIHGGPFANIAHGCNSVIATKTALGMVEEITDNGFVVTEAGFGADLGMEKFLDIKCRLADIYPDLVVIVATVRALKSHGGVSKDKLGEENLEAIGRGLPNLLQHIDNIKNVYGLPRIVALNHFPTDTESEIGLIKESLSNVNVQVIETTNHQDGGDGARALAEEVAKLSKIVEPTPKYCYNLDLGIKEKIETIAKKIYHAKGVDFTPAVLNTIKDFESEGFGNLPICIAKTQYSFSDNPSLIGAPKDFVITINNIKVSAGAGFIVAISGSVMTMPGLPKVPAANSIDVIDGKITGLF